MHCLRILILSLLSLLPLLSCRPLRQPRAPAASSVTGSRTLIIYYDVKVGKAALLQAVEKYQAKVIYNYQELNGIAVVIPAAAVLAEK